MSSSPVLSLFQDLSFLEHPLMSFWQGLGGKRRRWFNTQSPSPHQLCERDLGPTLQKNRNSERLLTSPRSAQQTWDTPLSPPAAPFLSRSWLTPQQNFKLLALQEPLGEAEAVTAGWRRDFAAGQALLLGVGVGWQFWLPQRLWLDPRLGDRGPWYLFILSCRWTQFLYFVYLFVCGAED